MKEQTIYQTVRDMEIIVQYFIQSSETHVRKKDALTPTQPTFLFVCLSHTSPCLNAEVRSNDNETTNAQIRYFDN